jgi:hypothetical protein
MYTLPTKPTAFALGNIFATMGKPLFAFGKALIGGGKPYFWQRNIYYTWVIIFPINAKSTPVQEKNTLTWGKSNSTKGKISFVLG